MRIVFMGTPEIAAGILRCLIGSRHEVIGVVTQPDKAQGRGNKVEYSFVKKVALEYNIPVYQPVKASDPAFVEQMRELAPDIICVAAYGQILKSDILELPKYRCVNVHASLLPKYRGASPIQWAVINGEEESGVTIMYMEKGLDTGDMILSKSVKLADDETAGSLHDKLMDIGGPLLLEALDLLEAGKAKPQKQNDAESTYVRILDKSIGNLDFNRPAVELERMIRGLNPWPCAFTYVKGKMLKLWKAEVAMIRAEESFVPGRIFSKNKEIFIATKEGLLKILELQLEGKKRMSAKEYLCGNSFDGECYCKGSAND